VGWETEGKGRGCVGEYCVGKGKGEKRRGVILKGVMLLFCREVQRYNCVC
jgi:hypothetical protein